MTWVRIISWHAVKLASDRVGRTWTLCGRRVEHADIVDVLPAGKSCETCLRIIARSADHG